MADSKDVDALQRRGRRRLIGAIALVLAAAIVLPMVFDSEPRHPPPAVSVRIPSEDDSAFAPRVAPAPAAGPQSAPAAPEKAATAAAEKAAPAAPEKAATAAPEKAATAAPGKAATAAAALPATPDASGTAQFIVPVAALASPDKLRDLTAQLKAAQLPFYTQPIATAKGQVTRVRAGPFASREAAEKALARMRALGLKPGAVAPKS